MTSCGRSLDDAGLFRLLADGIAGDAGRVIVGLNWTLVEGPAGIGLAQTPARGTAGCRGLPSPGAYAGRPLADLATLSGSDNVFERSLAVAAINAHWNRRDLEGTAANGLELVQNRGHHTVVIGRFPGLEKRLADVAVIEREPRPGEFSEEAALDLLPQAEYVAVTASTIANGSFPALAGLSRNAFTVVIGPGTPLCPRLFEHGVDAVAGFVVTDAEAVARVVSEGGAVSAFRPYGRNVTLTRDQASHGAVGPTRSTR